MQTHSVLNKAAVEVQVEISLGQLAAQRASNKEVREFGQQMVEDHKKVGQQVELLALKHGITLSPGEDHEHHKKLEELSRLSGHAFDREYMDYSIRDHESTLEAFQRRAQIVQDQDIKQWISLLLPILEGHREKAHRVKYSLQTNP
jgi:putative membrane protein